MNVRRALILIALCLLPQRISATAQQREVLLHEGKSYYLQTLPLTPYLEQHGDRLPRSEVMSTGLWRGYLGTWALRDGGLFVEDVRIQTRAVMDPGSPESERYRSVMRELFGAKGPQKATWFTGRLIVPTGEMVNYVHMGFASTYSSYLVATIVEGAVRDIRNMTQAEFETFRRQQFELFKKTPEYAAAVKEVQGNSEKADEEVEEFIFELKTGVFESRIFESIPRDRP